MAAYYQQEDLLALGKLILALACNSLLAVQRENLTTSLELISRTYSSDLRNLIVYLMNPRGTGNRSINDIMPMIGARFYNQLDAANARADLLENCLAKELENGRLFRLIVKLSTIVERHELNMDPAWSETGDRYLLKLFRDYVFHQVAADGRPWLDLSHVVYCLNRLDTGAAEKVCLMSRDEQSILITTYAELKQCMEQSFGEILASATPLKHSPNHHQMMPSQ
jgi:PAB-dependent poly(A)-specific ribonuclease subunit 3